MHVLSPTVALAALIGLPLLASPTWQEPAAEQEPAQEAEVEYVNLGAANIVPAEGVELMPWLRAYSGQMLLEAVVPHGTWVEEGQPLARLDLRSLRKQLEAAELALESAEHKLHAARVRAEMQQQSTEWDLHKKEMALQRAHQEMEAWTEFELEHREANQMLSAMYREHGLEDALDELMQLEAMYTADELTDATEEIVLKRSRRNLERSRFSAELQERQAAFTRETDWQRIGQSREVAVREAEMAMDQARTNARLGRHSLEAGLEKAERDLRDARQHLEQLRNDAEQLQLRAPRRGLLLHGGIADAGSTRHEMGGTLQNRRVAFSVVSSGKVMAQKKLSAMEFEVVRDGQSVEVVNLRRGIHLSGKLQVERFSGPGGHKAKVILDGEHPELVPGDSVTIRFRKES